MLYPTDKQDSVNYVQNIFDQLLVIKCLINYKMLHFIIY